jgi:Pyruvate/2-oxoacid:ferredoxin oxidoreductase gamma subunit
VVIVDRTQVDAPPPGSLVVPITALAREHAGKPIAAGIVSLGCVAAVARAVSLEAIERSMIDHVPGAVAAANTAACAAGYAAMRALSNGAMHA